MTLLFGTTIFTSAALLFMVQPLYARMLLPSLGGAPSVWNASMVFYQLVLLAGYGYAHWIVRLSPKAQRAVHLTVCLIPLILLPVSIPSGLGDPSADEPLSWTLKALALAVGIPFFALSTTSPLLQRWYAARTLMSSGASRDPYFLYAASNLGSLCGLLAYPLAVEPLLRLGDQSRMWSVGYVCMALLCAACAFPVPARSSSDAPRAAVQAGENPRWRDRGLWILWAFVPSSLLLGVTQYLSTDIATFPLLWVIPLALYLLTFVICFSERFRVSEALFRRVFPMAFAPLIAVIASRATEPIGVLLGLHLFGFFWSAGLFHSKLAASRPAPVHLTEFFLCVSIGGALGGVFNALVAPHVFSTVVEYPLVLAMAALLSQSSTRSMFHSVSWKDLAIPAAIASSIAIAFVAVDWRSSFSMPIAFAVCFGVPSVLCFLMSRHGLRFGLTALGILALSAYFGEPGEVLFRGRSFFGVHRVTLTESGKFHRLFHGNTVHGLEAAERSSLCEPLTYFHRNGPIGQVFGKLASDPGKRIGVIGLGAGSVACFGKTGQTMRFYEIDPVVERVARDRGLFGFLANSAADVDIVLGDARVSLKKAPNGEFDLFVLDAYSSDSIPVHLITREAVQLYLDKLSPHGVLVFHISNRHLDLGPVLRGITAELGLVYRENDHEVLEPKELEAGWASSRWAIAARRDSDLGSLAADSAWVSPPVSSWHRPWTDDYSSILSVLSW